MSLTSKNFLSLTADVSANDLDSGIKEYGYLIQNDSTCPTTGYMTTENSTYTFNVSLGGTYYVCVRITDKAGNSTMISESIELVDIDYEIISNNYSCANTQVGSSYLFTYTGNCSVINDSNGNYRIKFLSSGNFKTTVSLNVDIFLVGGGGGGGSDCDSDPGFYCQAGGGGGGGYTKTYKDVSLSATSYAINIGSGGGVGGSGGTSYFGDSSTYFANGGGAGTSSSGGSGGSGGGSASCCRMNTSENYYSTRGNGGSFGSNGSSCSADCPYHSGSSGGSGQGSTTCEFGLGTVSSCNSGVTVYSKGGTGSTWIENSGNGGNVSGSGSSGIVIMRNKR